MSKQNRPTGAPKAFRVVERIPVTTYVERVLLETDDGLEAEVFAGRHASSGHIHLMGVDPSHMWSQTPTDGPSTLKCLACGAPNNGCVNVHLPCGAGADGMSISDRLCAWEAQHEGVAEPLVDMSLRRRLLDVIEYTNDQNVEGPLDGLYIRMMTERLVVAASVLPHFADGARQLVRAVVTANMTSAPQVLADETVAALQGSRYVP